MEKVKAVDEYETNQEDEVIFYLVTNDKTRKTKQNDKTDKAENPRHLDSIHCVTDSLNGIQEMAQELAARPRIQVPELREQPLLCFGRRTVRLLNLGQLSTAIC